MSAKEEKKKTDQTLLPVTRQRILWPDIVRIIAIYFVIQVHTPFTIVSSHSAINVFNKLDAMGVPLFVVLSGALLLGKSEDYKTFFRKRCFKVLIPWVIWTFFYMAYAYTVYHSQAMSDFFSDNKTIYFQWLHFFIRTFLSGLYFLPLIFSIYLFTPILRIIVKYATDFDNFYILTGWFIIFSIMPWLIGGSLFPAWEPTLIFVPMQFCGYYLLGYVVIKLRLFQKISLPILLLISLFPFLLILIPTNSSYIQNFTGGYVSPGTAIATIFLFYFLFAIFEKYDKKINPLVRKIITMISGASFGVYLINEMLIDYFKNELLQFSSFLNSELLITIITFLILSLIVIIMQRLPILKYIVPR